MKAIKLKKLLSERGISNYELIRMMVNKGFPSVNLHTLNLILEGKKAITCTIGNRFAVPCLLQRICVTLQVSSSDILEY